MSGIRNTQAKTAIEDLIAISNEALSHHDIQNALNGLCNRVTIYRVLSRLEQQGQIHKIIDMDGIVKYATCKSDCSSNHSHSHTHVHFSCMKCNSVTCLEDVKPYFQLPSGYQSEEINFMISGYCPSCSSK